MHSINVFLADGCIPSFTNIQCWNQSHCKRVINKIFLGREMSSVPVAGVVVISHIYSDRVWNYCTVVLY